MNPVRETHISIVSALADLPDAFNFDKESIVPAPVKITVDRDDAWPSRESVDVVIGEGGTKKALKLGHDLVLMVPSAHGAAANSPELWKRTVEEEVAFSQFANEIGLLAVTSTKVNVWITDTQGDHPMVAYTSESFTSLAERNIYIIDFKVRESSTWNESPPPSATNQERLQTMGKRKLFTSLAQSLSVDSWMTLLDGAFLEDMHKMQKAGFDMGGDSMNLAVITDRHRSPKALRPFGLDFSSDTTSRAIPNGSKPLSKSCIEQLIRQTVDKIVLNELDAQEKMGSRKVEQEEYESLRNQLVDRCETLFYQTYDFVEKESGEVEDPKKTSEGLCARVWNALVTFLSWIFCCGSSSTAGEQEA